MLASDYMLTTTDNPYDPFSQFDEWHAFDEHAGYHTCGLLARIAPDLNEENNEEEQKVIDEAVDSILNLFPGLYTVIYKPKVTVGGGN